VDEVAVGSVDFDEFEASFEAAASTLCESVGDACDAFGCESFGLMDPGVKPLAVEE
jgi:hypothetical protein